MQLELLCLDAIGWAACPGFLQPTDGSPPASEVLEDRLPAPVPSCYAPAGWGATEDECTSPYKAPR